MTLIRLLEMMLAWDWREDLGLLDGSSYGVGGSTIAGEGRFGLDLRRGRPGNVSIGRVAGGIVRGFLFGLGLGLPWLW